MHKGRHKFRVSPDRKKAWRPSPRAGASSREFAIRVVGCLAFLLTLSPHVALAIEADVGAPQEARDARDALDAPEAQQAVESKAAPAPAIRGERVAGRGDWKRDGDAKKPQQSWNLDLHRGPNNTVEGDVTLSGSPLMSKGKLQGKIEGTQVSGVIVDSAGNHVAKFNGAISPQGFSGTYTDRTGEVGDWEWAGQLPE